MVREEVARGQAGQAVRILRGESFLTSSSLCHAACKREIGQFRAPPEAAARARRHSRRGRRRARTGNPGDSETETRPAQPVAINMMDTCSAIQPRCFLTSYGRDPLISARCLVSMH